MLFMVAGLSAQSKKHKKKPVKHRIQSNFLPPKLPVQNLSADSAEDAVTAPPMELDPLSARDTLQFASSIEQARTMAGGTRKTILVASDTGTGFIIDRYDSKSGKLNIREFISSMYNDGYVRNKPIVFIDNADSVKYRTNTVLPSLSLWTASGELLGKIEGIRPMNSGNMLSFIEQLQVQYLYKTLSKSIHSFEEGHYSNEFLADFLETLKTYIDANSYNGFGRTIRDKNLVLAVMDAMVEKQGATLYKDSLQLKKITEILWGENYDNYFNENGYVKEVDTIKAEPGEPEKFSLPLSAYEKKLETSKIVLYLIEHLSDIAQLYNGSVDYYKLLAGIHNMFRRNDPFELVELQLNIQRQQLFTKFIAQLDSHTASFHFEKLTELAGWYGIHTNPEMSSEMRQKGFKIINDYFIQSLHVTEGSAITKIIANYNSDNWFLNRQTYYGQTYGVDPLNGFREYFLDYISLYLNNMAWQAFIKQQVSDLEFKEVAIAVELNPKNGFYLDTYAHLQYNAGKKKEAILMEQKAIKYLAAEKSSANAAVLSQMRKDLQTMQLGKILKNTK
jgi:hypothetical protein